MNSSIVVVGCCLDGPGIVDVFIGCFLAVGDISLSTAVSHYIKLICVVIGICVLFNYISHYCRMEIL
jgi:type III secretory pathway component EscS